VTGYAARNCTQQGIAITLDCTGTAISPERYNRWHFFSSHIESLVLPERARTITLVGGVNARARRFLLELEYLR